MHPLNQKANSPSGRRYRVELITAESEASLFVRHRRLIRFPQLTMPLLAAWTPEHWQVSHTDEIVQRVDFDKRVDLVGITANTPAAPHAYLLAREFRQRGVAVVIGGPHATLLPDEVAQHADAAVIGEGELVWPELLADFERGELKNVYASCALPDLKKMPAPRWGPDPGARLWERRDHRHARMSVRLRVLHHSADVSAPDAVPAHRRSRR
jgi:radical SAM superfamily enzyme YgiQ (UPF0313 family)